MNTSTMSVEDRIASNKEKAKKGEIVDFQKIAKKIKDNNDLAALATAFMPSSSKYVHIPAVQAFCKILMTQMESNIAASNKPTKLKESLSKEKKGKRTLGVETEIGLPG